MMYLLALVFPPVAVLICGKPVQALLNVGLCLFGWVPGIIHALLVANNWYADRRVLKVVVQGGGLERYERPRR